MSQRLRRAALAALVLTASIVAGGLLTGSARPLEPTAAAAAAAAGGRPLSALSAAAGAVRHGPCSAAVGIVPDTGCPGGGSAVGGCPVLPSDNPWNTDISSAPVNPRSAAIVAEIQATGGTLVHPDFGSNAAYGIPFSVVPANQPAVPITYGAYGGESDPGPFPIPLTAPVEGGSDRHVLVVQQGTCQLFELYAAQESGNGWLADSGARFDLSSNALRTEGWTSADAAGLPILPGLVRYDEAASGHIGHALRFTVARTRAGHLHPATHDAPTTGNADAPPMGMRFRLRADFDRSQFTGLSRTVLDALATYGMIVADNGSNWYISGGTDPRWDDEDLNQLKSVPGTAFEVVDTGA